MQSRRREDTKKRATNPRRDFVSSWPKAPAMNSDTAVRLRALLAKRILLLDGAMGTMVQRHRLTQSDFRGDRFAKHHRDVRGNLDLLNLTRREIITDLHEQSLAAGSALNRTNS